MKKIVLAILVFFISCLCAMAKPPQLNVERIFDGSYNSNKSVSINISKSKGQFFRSCYVTANPSLVKTILKLFEKDLPRASESHDIISDGEKYSTMTIINNGLEICIGLGTEPNHGCYLFIKGPIEAFK